MRRSNRTTRSGRSLHALSATMLAAVVASAWNCAGAPEDVVSKCDQALSLPPSVATDILFVIDNSRSMREEQDKVIAQLHTFVTSLASGPIENDFQIGVVTTGVTQSSTTCRQGDPIELVEFPNESGLLQRGRLASGEPKVLASGGGPVTAEWMEKVKRVLDQGVTGSGQEMGFEAMRRALSAPLITTAPDAQPSGNLGLLRPGARLLVVIISDEDDCSTPTADAIALEPACGGICREDAQCDGEGHYCLLIDPFAPSRGRGCSRNVCETPEGRALLEPVANYVSFLQGLDDGTGRDRKRDVYLAVIGAVDATGEPARCRLGTDEAYGSGVRYAEAVKSMGEDGLIDSICNADYGIALQRIAELVSAPQTIVLAEPPADPRLLQVELTRAGAEKVVCRVGEGFSYEPPTAEGSARITLSGVCRLRLGDELRLRLICAG